ncbi:MAG TPA: hypothetical protein VF230_16900 [Acidimicrobiales bacterium]
MAALVVAATGLVAIGADPLPSAAAPSPFTRVGDLPLSQVTPILADPASKMLMVPNGPTIDLWDPMTVKKVRSISLAPYNTLHQGAGLPITYAWSPGQGKAFFLVYDALDQGRAMPSLATINPVTGVAESIKRIQPAVPGGPAPFPPGVVAQGMSYNAEHKKIYLLGQDPSGLVGDYNIHIAEVDATTATSSWTTPYVPGPACQKPVATSRQAAIHRPRGSNKIYFGCGTGNLIFSREPGNPGVAAVDITNPATPSLQVFPISGSYATGESLYDDAANRLILMSAGTNVPAQAAWIFDETHEKVIGVVSAGPANLHASGLDIEGGRLYVAIDNKLLISTDRGLKIPQATEVAFPGILGPNVVPIHFAKRIIITYREANALKVSVFESTVTDYTEPPVADPDASTIDHPETPGVTAVDFGADSKAYGLRAHQVAGVNGIGQNVVATNTDYWANTGGAAGYNDGDRNAWFARAIRARLGDSEASASAVTVDGDSNTQADYTKDTSIRSPANIDQLKVKQGDTLHRVEGQPWPYTTAACADLGAGAKSASVPATDPDVTVTCDLAKAKVETTAAHEAAYLADGLDASTAIIGAGAATSHTTLDRKTGKGVVVVSEAEARDVSILAGLATFGRIYSKAESATAGRPGTASADYKRVFENVNIAGTKCAQCDPVDVVARLNAVLPTSLRAELPAYEKVTTPRGARAAIQREPYLHQQDVTLNNDSETDLEVPALRITYYGDNAVRSRMIFEFAATQANSTYAIYLLPEEGFDPDIEEEDEEVFGDDESVEDFWNSEAIVGGEDEDGEGDEGDGEGDPEELVADPASNPGPGGGWGKRLGNGLGILFTGRGALVLNVLLWSLLSLPVFLAGRRRYLLRLIGGR